MAELLKASFGVALAFAAGSAWSQPVLGADAAACAAGAGGAAALVHVHGFKDRAGNLRVQTYTDRQEDFLERGRKLRRVEVPVAQANDMRVCIALPAPGRYTLTVLHDRDADGRLSISSDGVGFSNNPKLRFGKPEIDAVAFTAPRGVTALRVVLNYRQGLFSIRPLSEG